MTAAARRVVAAGPSILLVLASMWTPHAQAQDTASLRLRSLAASCAQCHGTDGRAVQGAAVPGLAGMPAAQLTDAMKGYKSGARAGTLMPQIAKGYSDEQITQLASYFAAVDVKATTASKP
jgi:sulfide dehydrogenase cytochrome subunit